jgi:molybdate transport system permease protein
MALTPLEIEALTLSLRVGVWATICSLPLGIAVAWLLARREFWGKHLVNGIVHLPLVLPPVVVGYALLVLLGRNGIIGAWMYQVLGITVAFKWQGAAIASGVMSFPLLVRAIRLSLEAIDRGLEAAARTLGASKLRVFCTITLPLSAPGILAGAILSFARSVGEFGATITFVSNIPGETRTLPMAIYSLTQTPGGDAAALRLTLISVALAIAALIGSEILAQCIQRRIGQTPAAAST